MSIFADILYDYGKNFGQIKQIKLFADICNEQQS